MTHERKRLGTDGEERAAAYLTHHGWDVVARNWRCRAGELDLVATRMVRRGKGRARLVAFVEVKTRRGGLAPKLSITRGKRLRLVRLAKWFLREKGWRAIVGRFDVVEVIWGDADAPVIRHHPGVFDASGSARR